jgi:hypothetical protein
MTARKSRSSWGRNVFGGSSADGPAARHTCASLLIDRGASVKAVASQLGHSTPTVTLNVYAHLFADDLDRLYERSRRTGRTESRTSDGLETAWPPFRLGSLPPLQRSNQVARSGP